MLQLDSKNSNPTFSPGDSHTVITINNVSHGNFISPAQLQNLCDLCTQFPFGSQVSLRAYGTRVVAVRVSYLGGRFLGELTSC